MTTRPPRPPRTLAITLKSNRREPVTPEDRDIAKIGLMQDAGRAGLVVVTAPEVDLTFYDEKTDMHVAVWYAGVMPDIEPPKPNGDRIIPENIAAALADRSPHTAAVTLRLLGCPTFGATSRRHFTRSVAIGAETTAALWPPEAAP